MFRLGWLFRYNSWESDALKNHPNLFIPDHSIYFEYKLHKKEKWRIGGKEEKNPQNTKLSYIENEIIIFRLLRMISGLLENSNKSIIILLVLIEIIKERDKRKERKFVKSKHDQNK